MTWMMTVIVHCSFLKTSFFKKIDCWNCLGGVWSAAIKNRYLKRDLFYNFFFLFSGNVHMHALSLDHSVAAEATCN
jgi:hypothetical protein